MKRMPSWVSCPRHGRSRWRRNAAWTSWRSPHGVAAGGQVPRFRPVQVRAHEAREGSQAQAALGDLQGSPPLAEDRRRRLRHQGPSGHRVPRGWRPDQGDGPLPRPGIDPSGDRAEPHRPVLGPSQGPRCPGTGPAARRQVDVHHDGIDPQAQEPRGTGQAGRPRRSRWPRRVGTGRDTGRRSGTGRSGTGSACRQAEPAAKAEPATAEPKTEPAGADRPNRRPNRRPSRPPRPHRRPRPRPRRQDRRPKPSQRRPRGPRRPAPPRRRPGRPKKRRRRRPRQESKATCPRSRATRPPRSASA